MKSQALRATKLGVVGVILTLGVACSAKPKPSPASAAQAQAAPTETARVTSTEAPMAAAPAVETLPVSVEEINRRGYLKDIFFDFDRADIRPDQRPVAAGDSSWLRKWSSVKVLVEGHCDERGTAKYNMALGEQRAEVVKDYLVASGVDPSRIQIVSYGKEKPFALGHDESSWAQNRRDHVLATSK